MMGILFATLSNLGENWVQFFGRKDDYFFESRRVVIVILRTASASSGSYGCDVEVTTEKWKWAGFT